jgi:hypothetical protein
VGFLVGLALSAVVTVPQGPPPSGPGAPPPPAPESSKVMLVLSTVSIALLLALLVVYGRTYRTTRAPYVLGLFVFLFVLLLESVLNSPILFSAFGVGPGNGLGRLLAFGQALMCAALALFLYLSLQ